jgi:hypothetical protein
MTPDPVLDPYVEGGGRGGGGVQTSSHQNPVPAGHEGDRRGELGVGQIPVPKPTGSKVEEDEVWVQRSHKAVSEGRDSRQVNGQPAAGIEKLVKRLLFCCAQPISTAIADEPGEPAWGDLQFPHSAGESGT